MKMCKIQWFPPCSYVRLKYRHCVWHQWTSPSIAVKIGPSYSWMGTSNASSDRRTSIMMNSHIIQHNHEGVDYLSVAWFLWWNCHQCSLWCPWSQVQQDTSGPDNFRILGCLWAIHYRYTSKWDLTEMLSVSFPLRAKTVWNPLRMNTERYRREEGHNSYPLECRLSAGRLFRQKPRKYCQLEIQASWWCHLQSTCF